MARLQEHPGLRAEVAATVRLGVSLTEWSTWDDDDRAWVLALLEWESSRCPGCGGWLHETTDPATEGTWLADDPVRCFRCTALHGKQDNYKDHPYRSAQVLWPVTRRTRGR